MASNRTMQIVITAKDKTKKAFISLKRSLGKLGGVAKTAGLAVTAAFGVIGAAITAVVVKNLSFIDSLAKTSSKLGVTTEALAAYHLAGKLAGLSTQELNTGLQMMSRNVADAANGVGLAKDALEDLGLSAEELRDAGPEAAFEAIITKLNGVDNALDRTNYAMDIFGRSGAGLINLTGEALRKAREEAEKLGTAISKQDAKKVEDANDAWVRLWEVMRGAGQTLTVTIAPTLTKIFDKLREISVKADFKGKVKALAADILALGKLIVQTIPVALLAVLEIIGKISMGIKGWRLLWEEAVIHAYGFAGAAQEILQFVADGFRQILQFVNFGGVFDGAIDGLMTFSKEQSSLINQLNADRDKAIQKQNETINAHEREQQKIEEYKEKVKKIEKTFDGLGNAITEGLGESTEKSADKAVKNINRVISKLDELQKKQGFVQLSSGGKTSQRSFTDADLEQRVRTEGE